MTKTELKDFLFCSESEINELQKYVKEFFGDYYNYLIKDTVINYAINYKTIIDIFFIFNEMNLKNIKNNPEFFFRNIGNFADKGLKSYQIAEQMLGLWAFYILDNRSARSIKINQNMKLKIFRTQEVEVELTRQPTEEEIKILEGKNDDKTLFDLDIIDFDTEKIIDEDYSNDVHQYIPFNEIIE